jgi:hypothetical protein
VTGDITNAGRIHDAEKILKKIASVNPHIYAQIGNMDYPEITNYLEQHQWNIHAKGIQLTAETGLMGVGYSNPTPFGTPSEVDDTTLAKWLDTTYNEIKEMKQFILVTHAPPFDCQADCLDNGHHVGSMAVKKFIDQYQPDICIAGHIHEAVTEEWLGQTKLINPGMISAGGYAIIEQHETGLKARLARVPNSS